MTRIVGVLGLLVVLYGVLAYSDPAAVRTRNLVDIANNQGYYGVITLGASLVIILGGIDLSIGSVLGCSAILFAVLMKSGVHPYLAVATVVCFGATVGLVNGLLITVLRLQPFLVTLCGMFIFRGVARMLSGKVDLTRSIESHPEFHDALLSLRYVLVGKYESGALVFPAMFVIMILLAALIGFFLHFSAYGRYWYAIGHNEQAARFAGVNVGRQRVVVYIVCSCLAAFAGVLFLLNLSTADPANAGESRELYAILGAVLGGCSLRGGEGTAVGMVLGAMVLPVVDNLLTFLGVKSDVIPVVIGLTLLFGTIVDELIRRRSRVNR